MDGNEYRDLIASYVAENFSPMGLTVYTEVPFGKTVIGKNRRVDLFLVRERDQRAFAIECKYQATRGTTDEKIPYALQDLEALWVPGCLVYAGDGWSEGVLHTLQGSKLAVYCLPNSESLTPSKDTRELDYVIAAVFGLWSLVIPEARRFQWGYHHEQLMLPSFGVPHGTKRAIRRKRKKADKDAQAQPAADTKKAGQSE